MLYIINFKTYKEAMGIRAVKLAEIASELEKKLNTEIIVAPQFTDLERV